MGDMGSGKPDIDDISLDDARPAKRSKGTGAALGIIILIAIVALLWIVGANRNAKRAAEEKAKADAAQARAAQMNQVKANVEQAMIEAQAGNISSALSKLEVVENQLGLIITTANTDGDQQAASAALSQKQAVIDARKAIEAQQASFQAAVSQSLAGLASTFGVAVPAPTTTEPAAPAATGAEGNVPAPATPEAATPVAPTTPETAAPATPAPAAPAAPAPAAAPAAPAAPAPAPAAAAS